MVNGSRLEAEGWRMHHDFSALELSLRTGDRFTLDFSESGFVFGRNAAGEARWLPDAVLHLPD